MTLQQLPSEFPYTIYEENFIYFLLVIQSNPELFRLVGSWSSSYQIIADPTFFTKKKKFRQFLI